QAQIRRIGRLGQAERIQSGAKVAAGSIGGDQTTDVAFALVAASFAGAAFQRALGGVHDMGNDGRMGNITCFAALETVEVGLPFGIDTVRRDEVLLVQILDIGGVAAGELR